MRPLIVVLVSWGIFAIGTVFIDFILSDPIEAIFIVLDILAEVTQTPTVEEEPIKVESVIGVENKVELSEVKKT